jgi:hypothetical protein
MNDSLNIQLIKRGGVVTFYRAADKAQQDAFFKSLPEGTKIFMTLESSEGDGRLGQIGRIYGCLRKLADETGVSPAEMKLVIKQEAGFVVGEEIRSIGDMSKKELDAMMQTIISKGDFVGMNLR